MSDSDILDFLEKVSRKSYTGVSFDYIPPIDGESGGYRFMRRFWIGPPKKTLREAIVSQRHLFDEEGNLIVGRNQ